MSPEIKPDSLLSIVTIHKGDEENLTFTLNSLNFLGPLKPHSELIVVNANHFNYEFYAGSFVRQEQFININSGIFHAMNFGLKKCRGKYVVFLNSGDSVSSEVDPELILNQLLEDSPWFVAKARRRTFPKLIKEEWFLPKSYLRFYLAINSYCHQSTFVRRHILCELGGFTEENSVADWEVSFNLYQIQKPIAVNTYWAEYAGLGNSDFPDMKVWSEDVSKSRTRSGIPVFGLSRIDFGLQKLISIILRIKNFKNRKNKLKALSPC